jgi:hypothetical protein
MEGSPADRLKQILDQYPSPTFWDKFYGPLRTYLASKVRQHFSMIFSEEDVVETADETIVRIFEHCDFELLSQLPEDFRVRKFFAFLNITLRSAGTA